MGDAAARKRKLGVADEGAPKVLRRAPVRQPGADEVAIEFDLEWADHVKGNTDQLRSYLLAGSSGRRERETLQLNAAIRAGSAMIALQPNAVLLTDCDTGLHSFEMLQVLDQGQGEHACRILDNFLQDGKNRKQGKLYLGSKYLPGYDTYTNVAGKHDPFLQMLT